MKIGFIQMKEEKLSEWGDSLQLILATMSHTRIFCFMTDFVTQCFKVKIATFLHTWIILLMQGNLIVYIIYIYIHSVYSLLRNCLF